MSLLRWIRKWDLQNDTITGNKADMMEFDNFIERSDGSMDPEKAVRVFNIHRGFHQRINYHANQ